jgi:uncharacterized protein (TIGR02246 family)
MDQHSDLEAIRELYNRYAISWDDDHPEDFAACFTSDAVFESARGRFAGRDAILGNMATVNRALGARKQRHLTANVSIELQGDRATGTAYFIYCVGCEGKTELTAFGTYRDELRKVDGHWFFAARSATVEGQ